MEIPPLIAVAWKKVVEEKEMLRINYAPYYIHHNSVLPKFPISLVILWQEPFFKKHSDSALNYHHILALPTLPPLQKSDDSRVPILNEIS